MKVKNLRLKGFIGIKRGLGLDEISIDFSVIEGLVAFAGQNGLGKSTILENLHPYNTLASREGALFNHVLARNAEKELYFEYNGHDYRTLIKIDAQSQKSEGFIWVDGQSVVNGKISAYAKYITEVFGSSNLFFNSVFCAQNATKLSDMTTGQIKTLFAEFLRLDRLQGYEESCKQKINVLSGKTSQIDINIAALQKRLGGAQDLQTEIDRLTNLKAEQEANKTELSGKLANLQKERENLKEVIARNEVLTLQVNEMTDVLNGMQDRLFFEGSENESSLSKLRTQYKEINDEITRINDILKSEASIAAAVENGKELQELIDNITTSLDAATNATAEAQAKVTAIEKEIQELKNKVILPEKDAEYQRLNLTLSSLKQDIKGLEKQLLTLDARDPECTSKTCSFIVAALEAEKELPSLRERCQQTETAKNQRTEDLMNAVAEIGRQIDVKESKLKGVKAQLTKQQELQSHKRKELAEKRLELTRYQNLSSKQSEIAVAKSQLEDRAKALGENTIQGKAIAEAWKAKKEKLESQIEEQKEKRDSVIRTIDTKALPVLCDLELDYTRNQVGLNRIDKDITETSNQIAAKQGELRGITEAEAQRKTAKEEKARVSGDISDWTYIRNACGKNGLQAMEIDATAPLISHFANDLLAKAFGPLFSVKLLTQDENGKECLGIIVINDDGDEINLANLSGGQKVWCLMALRLAMTLLSKEKGGHAFLTAFSDESDGPLDSENAQNYVSMYRSFMDVGRFESFLFISHRPECRSMADHVLNFEKGKNPYWN